MMRRSIPNLSVLTLREPNHKLQKSVFLKSVFTFCENKLEEQVLLVIKEILTYLFAQ